MSDEVSRRRIVMNASGWDFTGFGPKMAECY